MSEIRKRSVSYPGASLADSLANVRQVNAKVGSGFHKREEVSAAIGSPNVSGASARKIAAMNAFGLLERSGDGYAVSHLARRLLRPLPEEEKELLKQAFFSVSLYKDVYDAYLEDGKLPESFPVLLERKFGIADGIGDYAARILKDSGITAGLLEHDGNYLLESYSQGLPELNDYEKENVPDKKSSREERSLEAESSQIRIELPRPHAIFVTEKSLTVKEKARLIEWIDKILKVQIDFLVEEKEDLGEDA